jgi:hypothetical protein
MIPTDWPILAMDSGDWGIFVVACLAILVSIWAQVRWWIKNRANARARDWQSFWMIAIGLLCFVAIVCIYLFKLLAPGRT